MYFLVRNDLRMLEFEDNLIIESLSGAEIGTFSVTVKPVLYQRQNCFKVEAHR